MLLITWLEVRLILNDIQKFIKYKISFPEIALQLRMKNYCSSYLPGSLQPPLNCHSLHGAQLKHLRLLCPPYLDITFISLTKKSHYHITLIKLTIAKIVIFIILFLKFALGFYHFPSKCNNSVSCVWNCCFYVTMLL